MSSSLRKEFGLLRSIFWPIRPHERAKVLPMLLMLFCICFNYSLLRNLKDSLVVTSSSAEVIPFIKVWLILPCAIFTTFLFTKLSSLFTRERVFYIITSGFIAFFLLFACLLYPIRESLYARGSADWLSSILPSGFSGLVAMYRFWPTTLFYVISEQWGTIVLTVLFWGLANDVVNVKESRRLYGTFALGSNVSGILAGQAGNFLTTHKWTFLPTDDPWQQTLIALITLISLSGSVAMFLFYRLNRSGKISLQSDPTPSKKKKRLSLRESFRTLLGSNYLILIAIIVMSYNLVITMVEVVWKDYLRLLYPSPGEYMHFLNQVTSMIGIVSTIGALLLPLLIERLGWTLTALITPAVMLGTSITFFSCILFKQELTPFLTTLIGTTPLFIAVLVGGIQNCFSKAAKYSVFDATKEMTFIPLDAESRRKGKAAIDGVGSRLGKSGGSLMHQMLLLSFGTIHASIHFVAGIIIGAILLWIGSIRLLGQRFTTFEQEPAQARAEPPSKEKLPELT